MTDDLRRLAEAATPGPWRWYGQKGRHISLATVGRGILTVMGSKRLGMQGAEPTFPVWDNPESRAVWGYHGGRLTGASELAIREVTYRDDITGIEHPNAAYIAALSPSTVLPLLDVVEAARQKLLNDCPDGPCGRPWCDALRAALERLDRP